MTGSKYLVLSLFPGADLFGEAFRKEGFCVVRGPELLLGQDIRTWSAIESKFDIVIGGPPCKSFSNARRGNIALEGNLIPEFERVVAEAKPMVFVMENVPQAPTAHVEGYAIQNLMLNAHHYGANQNRVRRFTFGYLHDGGLESWPFHVKDPLPRHERTPDPFPTVMACEHKYPTRRVAGHKVGRRLTIHEVCELQGVPKKADMKFLQRGTHTPFKVEFTYVLIGNGVEMNTGRVVARTVRNGMKRLVDRREAAR